MPPRYAAKIDCHIHSQYSPDGRGTLKELVLQGRAKNLTGIVVTDHNSLRMAKDIKATKFQDFTVIQGMEISTRQGHCLALGVREEVPRNLMLHETLDRIDDAGGVGVPSHPFRRLHGVGEVGLATSMKQLCAIEVYNARDGPRDSNKKSAAIAERNEFGGTGGSDAHQIFEIGNAYTVFKKPVDSADDLVSQIAKGSTWGVGVPTPRHKLWAQNAKNAWLFAKRGFKGI